MAFVGFRWSSLVFVGFRWLRWFSLVSVGFRWRSLVFVGFRWCVGDFRLLLYAGDIDCSAFIAVATISSCSSNMKNVRFWMSLVSLVLVGFRWFSLMCRRLRCSALPRATRARVPAAEAPPPPPPPAPLDAGGRHLRLAPWPNG